MKSLSIILPTYNEAGNIANLIKTIYVEIKKINLKPQFIVVDDNSPDGTAKIASQLRKKLPVKVLIRKNEKGLATAILHGIKNSKSDLIVLMDADFNHKPQDVPWLLQPILKSKVDIVIGSRYIPGGGMHITEANKFQFFLSKNGNFFVNRILLNLPVHESLSGFVAFKRTILDNLNVNKIFQGYGEYCIQLLYKSHRRGVKIVEVPVIYGRRRWGQSKSKLIKMAINYFKTAVLLRLDR